MLRRIVGQSTIASLASGLQTGHRSQGIRPLALAARFLATSHRPHNEYDEAASRRVLTGRSISAHENPGVRIQTKFIPEVQAAELVHESREVDRKLGFSTAGHGLQILSIDSAKRQSEGAESNKDGAGEFFSRRVTGRPEGQETVAPWGYGDQFRIEHVPLKLRQFVGALQNCSSFRLGPPRDITINYRKHSFFRLDPHVDPIEDGPNVFILGLLSDVVVTFVPPENIAPRRNNIVEIATKSWTDQDIDVLLQQRSIVHFTGAAREHWGHAIRGGLEVEEAPGRRTVVDWWGRPDFMLRRGDERISIVVAFADP